MPSHSAIGGSSAHRIIACPGSVQAIWSLPPSADRPSEYSEEGTFAHAVMEYIMTTRQLNEARPNDATITYAVKGKTFHDRVVTGQHLNELIEPALDALDELEERLGGGFKIYAIEQLVKFPKLFDSYGTVDLILYSEKENRVLLVDWKFGAGVPVVARHDNGDINAQLLYYTTAARYSFPRLFRGRDIFAAIIQPRSPERSTHTLIRAGDITQFRMRLEGAVKYAFRHDPPKKKGEHCRWAPCKATCHLWTGPLIDLSAIQLQANLPAVASKDPKIKADVKAYGEFLSRAKGMAELAVMYKKEIDEQMLAFLQAGGIIPGWRLKLKTKVRQWIDPEEVFASLRKLGFKATEIYRQKLLTFEQADALAKRKGVEIPEHLRVVPPTNEVTLATSDDPAPVVQRPQLIEQFRESLKLLQEASR